MIPTDWVIYFEKENDVLSFFNFHLILIPNSNLIDIQKYFLE